MSKDGTIFIIDDDASIREVFEIILLEQGYPVRQISSEQELEQRLLIERPRLIFLDLNFGESKGQDVAQKLKANTKTEKIPIIIVSALSNAKEIALEIGVSDVLEKPFQIEDVLNIVKKHY